MPKLTKSIKREILGLYPDWKNDANISDNLYNLLTEWAREVEE